MHAYPNRLNYDVGLCSGFSYKGEEMIDIQFKVCPFSPIPISLFRFRSKWTIMIKLGRYTLKRYPMGFYLEIGYPNHSALEMPLIDWFSWRQWKNQTLHRRVNEDE